MAEFLQLIAYLDYQDLWSVLHHENESQRKERIE